LKYDGFLRMKPASLLRISAIVLLASGIARPFHDEAVENMVQTAKAFVASLDDQQLSKAKIDFKSDERENWHFIPKSRKGLPLREMTPSQKSLAHSLLSAGLSTRGFIKATEIMSLEEILKKLEQGSGPVRDPEGYFFSIFGEPSESGTWGYRIEGHHISLNFTLVNGKIADTPQFFGANPADIKEGPRRGLRVLAHEEDYARALIDALSADQRKAAIVNDVAYPDILTSASRKAALEGQPSGIQASALNPQQRQLLQRLVEEYANNMAPELAAQRMDMVKQAGDNMHFAWAGMIGKGQPHYYRIQTTSFLIEYDDTQNNANHIHTVWRDYEKDFGRDLLKEHYQTARDHSHN
jgi:Protein of unknown function (DUF3500)